MSDSEIRKIVEDIPVPDFPSTPFKLPPALNRACVAVVSTAGLSEDGAVVWDIGDPRFAVLNGDGHKAVAMHVSPNFDRTGFLADPNVVMPIDRLRELAERGVIGSVAPRHISFMGAQYDAGLSAMRLDSGPAAARLLKKDGVDVAIITGVCPYCTRTACALAHAIEGEGISTIVLASVRGQAIRSKPPRALYCEFPFGRALGRAHDPEFQIRVLEAAFATLQSQQGPVFAEFPESIGDDLDHPVSCALAPRFDPNLHPAVDEAKGLLPAYKRAIERFGKTHVGRAISAEEVPDAIDKLANISLGLAPEDTGLPIERIPSVAADIRWYYEEAALELAGSVPSARAIEAWIYEKTELGRVLLQAQLALKKAGFSRDVWFFLVPADRARAFSGDRN